MNLPQNAVSLQQGTIGPGYAKKGAQNPRPGNSGHNKVQTSYGSNAVGKPYRSTKEPVGFLERYDDGMTVFVCISGVITALLAFFTFTGKWVSLESPFFNLQLSLLEVSEASKSIAGITQYFDSDTTSTLGLISLASTVSFWILLLGAIASLVISVLILISPKIEFLVFIPAFIITAFAVIGIVFTAAPIFASQDLGFMPIPISMLIIAGVPAGVIKFIG
jgi:hypothetical protein